MIGYFDPIHGIFCVTCVTLMVISGIFFLYNFLVRDPGKRVHSDASDALTSLAGAGVFGARRNSWKWAFGRVSGTWKGSAIPEPEGPGPTRPLQNPGAGQLSA